MRCRATAIVIDEPDDAADLQRVGFTGARLTTPCAVTFTAEPLFHVCAQVVRDRRGGRRGWRRGWDRGRDEQGRCYGGWRAQSGGHGSGFCRSCLRRRRYQRLEDFINVVGLSMPRNVCGVGSTATVAFPAAQSYSCPFATVVAQYAAAIDVATLA